MKRVAWGIMIFVFLWMPRQLNANVAVLLEERSFIHVSAFAFCSSTVLVRFPLCKIDQRQISSDANIIAVSVLVTRPNPSFWRNEHDLHLVRIL